MRISSMHIFNIARNGMAQANQETVKTQEQMSTGKRVLSPSDDPVAATKIIQITDELNNIDQYLKNIHIAENNLKSEETVIGNVVSVVQRLQEMAVAAGNTATLTPFEYKAMAKEISTRVDEVLNLMNTKNANGDYVFGGYKSTQPPFVGDTFGGFGYQGDDGQFSIKVANGTQMPSSDSGKHAFMDIRSVSKSIETSVSVTNQSQPPASISVGQIVNPIEYSDFYPEDIVISFNADTDVAPPRKNFTATERSTGRIIAAKQTFIAGDEVRIKGVSVKIVGVPNSGKPAQPANILFGLNAAPNFPFNFSAPNQETVQLSVGGRTEKLILDANITSQADLVANLTDVANGNADRLANLGVTVDTTGIHMPLGLNIQISLGSANSSSVLGVNTLTPQVSQDGVQAVPGDRFFIDSTEKQGLLNTLARFKEGLEAYDGSEQGKKEVSSLVADTLGNLANSINQLTDVQAKVGARLNTLESTRDLHLDTQLISKEILGELRDVDYADASARLAQQTLILQATQQSFVRVSQLSLFDRL